MGMTIDEAIKQLEQYTIPCGKYKKAYDFAIDTMRKYQRIQEIINNAKDSDGAVKYNWLYEQICEVVEDGKID